MEMLYQNYQLKYQLFLILFAFTNFKLQALVFLSVCAFLLIPINLSKKNRMYKVVIVNQLLHFSNSHKYF